MRADAAPARATCAAAGKFLALGLCLLLAAGAIACRSEARAPARTRLLVVGVDGADPGVIRRLARNGQLPHLAALIERGSFVPLKSDFKSASPVVWTTIVTGMGPDEHGIADFLVADGKGSAPVTSGARLRPALWNMLDRVGRRGAFLGVWATWPVEPTSGLLLSDRAFYKELAGSIHPPEREESLARWRELAAAPGNRFPPSGHAEQDRLVNLAAREAVADDRYDLVFAYFRSVDVVSHHSWHLFEPKPFRRRPPKGVSTGGGNPVLEAYRAIDSVIGELIELAPEDTNVMVVSDHGFKAQPSARPQVMLGFDLVLAELGFVVWQKEGAVDTARSTAWTHASPAHAVLKRIRTRTGLAQRSRAELTAQLRRELSTCRFAGGGAAFELREPKPGSEAENVVLEAVVQRQNASNELLCRDRPVPKAVGFFGGPVTGGHDSNTAGTLIVSGPLFARGASQPGVSVRDVTPTILYALGLPVGRDFIGKPALDLFAADFRRTHPVRQIESWGKRERQEDFASSVDEKLIEELVGLGYLQ